MENMAKGDRRSEEDRGKRQATKRSLLDSITLAADRTKSGDTQGQIDTIITIHVLGRRSPFESH